MYVVVHSHGGERERDAGEALVNVLMRRACRVLDLHAANDFLDDHDTSTRPYVQRKAWQHCDDLFTFLLINIGGNDAVSGTCRMARYVSLSSTDLRYK